MPVRRNIDALAHAADENVTRPERRREEGTASMHANKRVILLALVASAVASYPAGGVVGIIAGGDWSVTISTADLLGGAGTDLQGTYESPSNQVLLSVGGTTGPTDTWRVDVRRSDATWHEDVHLSILRTGDGAGGSVSGGLESLEILGTDTTFLSGSDDVTGIPCQLILTGISIQVPPGAYGTTVVFTVVDT
ncbi:hypothetical protein ACFLTM_05055 [Candidatus Bipolaricaulota bacterium]